MGILRADRVSGLGGANAITGSVFFGRNGTSAVASGNWLTAYSESDFSFGTGDFTIEYWFYFTGVSGSNSGSFQISNTPGGINNANGASTGGLALNYENGCVKGIGNNGWFNGSNSVSVGTWNHAALVRHSGTLQIFTNGVADTSASDSNNYSLTHLAIGGYYTNAYLMTGYISNFRIVKGTAVYSAAFTPPTERLTAIDGTVLLACQSPGNILQEETGKTFAVRKVNSNDAPPMASRFVPDKGKDYGTTFTDNTKFDTLSYLVPPGGTTTQVSRGRGLMMGGGGAPGNQWAGHTNIIDYVEIMSMGNAIDFGDLTNAPYLGNNGCISSSTRGLQAGGFAPSSTNVINYMTIASPGDALDFGDLTNMKSGTASLSSQTRGIFAGGDPTGGAYVNSIDYITIATTGDSATFGDLVGAATRYATGTASPTRGIIAGGAAPAAINTIEYVTIASTGNATDFGDMSYTGIWPNSVSGGGRAIIAGSATEPNQNYNTMDYIIISSTGNGTDFADMDVGKGICASMSNKVRGLFGRGEYNTQSRYYTNAIEQITISSNGNATDFGDSVSSTTASGGSSDSHGGIA